MICRTVTVALLVCLLAGVSARAEDVKRFDDDKAKEIAKALVDAIAKIELPVKTSLDGKSGTGLHADKAGVFVTPDTKLTEDAVKKLDKNVLPLGVLFVTDVVTVVSADKPVKDHHTAEVSIQDQTITVNVLTLALAKVAERPVLLVYAKGKKPVVVAELNEADEKSDHTLNVDARKAGDKRAVLTLNVLGKYRATLQLSAKEE